jgi:hypothetical protein
MFYVLSLSGNVLARLRNRAEAIYELEHRSRAAVVIFRGRAIARRKLTSKLAK